MYCRRCGKFIHDDVSEYCEQCKIAVYPQINQIKEPQHNLGSAATGFGVALTSAILGVVSCVTVIMCFFFGILSFVEPVGIMAIFLWMASVALSITSLVLGIKSIKTFINEKKSRRKLPVATLVLGICGVSFSVDVLIICAFFFMIVFINTITVGW